MLEINDSSDTTRDTGGDAERPEPDRQVGQLDRQGPQDTAPGLSLLRRPGSAEGPRCADRQTRKLLADALDRTNPCETLWLERRNVVSCFFAARTVADSIRASWRMYCRSVTPIGICSPSLAIAQNPSIPMSRRSVSE
jgi:hypothetical protein